MTTVYYKEEHLPGVEDALIYMGTTEGYAKSKAWYSGLRINQG